MARWPFLREEHELFRQAVDSFVERECPREYCRELDRTGRYPYELYDKIAAQGWFGLGLPAQYGGHEGDMFYRALICELLAKYAFDIATGYSNIMWGAWDVNAFGTEAQKAHYLPKVIKGEIKFSFSMTEPGAGSDAAAISLSAVPDGDYFVLNGHKVFATASGPRDNIIVLVARTDSSGPRHRGLSLFLVPNDAPGLEIRRMNTLARRVVGTNELFFTDVRVHRDQLLGILNEGWRHLMSHLEVERLCVASEHVGNAQTAVDDAVRYAQQREQFGQPIGKFQAIAHMLADMETDIAAARLMVYHLAWLLNEKLPCRKEAAMAKLYASEAYLRVATQGMQVLGGYGQLHEYDMERYWRDARVATIGAGTSQIQRNIIARALGL